MTKSITEYRAEIHCRIDGSLQRSSPTSSSVLPATCKPSHSRSALSIDVVINVSIDIVIDVSIDIVIDVSIDIIIDICYCSWALAVTMWEIFNLGSKPYNRIQSNQAVQQLVISGSRWVSVCP